MGYILERILLYCRRELTRLVGNMARYLPGDIVSRRKGIVMHKGVVLGDGRVLHNTPLRGEHITTEEEFRAGKRVYVTRQERTARERALAHADRDPNASYNLLTNNCEHTVHRATRGQAHSPQLKSWALGLAIGGAALALTRHPAVAAAGFALGRRLARGSND